MRESKKCKSCGMEFLPVDTYYDPEDPSKGARVNKKQDTCETCLLDQAWERAQKTK